MSGRLHPSRSYGRAAARLPSSESEDCSRASKYVVAVYFSNWSVYQREHFPTNIDYKYVTHVFYSFLHIDTSTGSVKFSDSWADIEMSLECGSAIKVNGAVGQLQQLKLEHPHLKVCFSIGGWGANAMFEAVVADSNKLQAFVSSAVELVRSYCFDGVDIDWEYPNNRQQGSQLVCLLRCLRQALNTVSSDLLLTVASPGSEDVLNNMDLYNMDAYLSFWNVMCYDFCGQGWSQHTGYHSNLYEPNGDNGLNCASILQTYINRGIAPSKLVLGMPLYGRKFSHVPSATIGCAINKRVNLSPDTVDYKLLPLPGTEEMFDTKRVSAFSYDQRDGVLVTYDNPQSAVSKAEYVVAHGLRGGMFWDSAGDAEGNRSLIRTFGEHVQASTTHS